MRGYRLPKASSKLDVVIVAARYTKRSKQLKFGQAYVRRGLIWGDLMLLSRDELVQRITGKQRVVTGTPAEIPGEFVVFNHAKLSPMNGGVGIHVGEVPPKGDDLDLPLF